MQPRVFRGVGSRGVTRLVSLAVVYAGGFGVLWGLGLVVRGWQGWAILAAPLLALIATRVWAWHRVSVAVNADTVRYEGASPSRDWEVPLERVESIYFDGMLPGRPLVLALDDDERVCMELSPRAARALHAHLLERGVRTPR